MKKREAALFVALAVMLLLLVWMAIHAWQLPTVQAPAIAEGEIDLSGIDLNGVVALLPLDWEFYEGLYTPEELAAGAAGEPRAFLPEDETSVRAGTYRARLRLRAGGVMYALNAWSMDYATRVYANGEEVLRVGTVAADAEDFVPRIQSYVLPLYAQDEVLELVVQYANFSHPEGGVMRDMAFSTFENIERYARDAMLPVYLFSGGLVLLAAFYLMQFVLYRARETAAFSLCCLLLALRSQQLVISVLFPDYNWYALYRAFFAGSTMICPSFLLLSHFLFPGRFRPWVLWATLAALVAVDCLVAFLPITIGGGLIVPAVLLTLPAALYYFVRLIALFPASGAAGRLSILGMAIFLACYTVELVLQNSIPFITRTGLGPYGMAIAVLCYMMALNLRHRQSVILLERERQRADDLAEVSAMKTEFLENVTHELKTPLAVISGYAQDSLVVLGDEEPSLADLKHNQRHIESEADRLNRMVNQLLDVAAIEGGRMSMRWERVSLADLLGRLADTCFSMIDPNGNALKTNIASGLPEVVADRERIEQVMFNLLSNAARHTQGGTITLSLSRREGWQAVCVADDGEGMETDILNQVFKRYVERQNPVTGRSGMGLYICKKIIDAHGGEIKIESAPGKGTAITFRLPEGEKEAEA